MTTAPTIRRSWLRPRFSLRVLLLAVTGFAIGFPIWWRWPYEEVYQRDKNWTTISTWQRKWGGGRLKQGPERNIVFGQSWTVNYRDGLRHGPAIFGKPGDGIEGQFENGLQHGPWTYYNDGQKQVIIWDHGKKASP